MKINLNQILSVLLIFSLSCLVMSCSKDDEDSGTLPSGGGGDSPIDDVPIGEVENTGFWINLETGGQFDTYLHKAGMYGSDCFVPLQGGDARTDCILDVLEGDLYLYDLPIQLNAPPGLCDAVSWRPAWHWNESSGFGPNRVVVEDDRDGGQDPEFVACTARNASSVNVACSAHEELIEETNLDGPTCVYNRTSAGGNNCCFGDYTFIRLQDIDEDGAGEVPVEEERNWGGDPKNCIAPELQRSWGAFTASGYPGGLIKPVPKDEDDQTVGFNDNVFELKANATGPLISFSTHANFYTQAGSPHAHDGYVSPTNSTKPYAVEPVDDLDGSLIPSGAEYYIFRCLDSGDEIKHEIRLSIREWNTVTEFLAFGTSEGVGGDPDVGGTEGTGCGYDPVFGYFCNDFVDLDDVLTEAGGSYNTTPGPGAAADRRTYFPNFRY